MAIIREIHAWSKDLADWQQDAIARLYADRTLTSSDVDDLYALAKAEAGIADEDNRVPRKLPDADVAPPLDPTRLVQLVAVKDLINVNALAHGERLPISPTGLTVIYGENGAGKSGYSRVFKHACRARDRREPILPNANLDPKTAGTAQAVFEVLVDGKAADVPWATGSVPSELLSDISIFDTYCARAYIDNQGDFAYVPYGLDILEGLVGVCGKLKARALQEKTASAPSDKAYAALALECTAVADVLNNLSAKTKKENIEALSDLSDVEKKRLALLAKTLAEPDPKQKAQASKHKASRLNGLRQRITDALALVGDDKFNELRFLIENWKATQRVAELAAKDFLEAPGQLPGTGGEEWKDLFEAAREFAKTSHPGHEFPHLPESAACPLCQNPLGSEGSQRLVHFDQFIKRAAEEAAKKARAASVAAFKAIQQANVDLLIDEALFYELAEIEPELGNACTTMQESLLLRRNAAIQAAGGELAWDDVVAILGDPRSRLEDNAKNLQEQAKVLESTADEKSKAAMVAEHIELDARRRLHEIKAAVLDAVDKHVHCEKLQNCIDGMDTRAISRKSTDISRTMASQELADALNEELKRLKVHELKVVMRPESPGGRTQFKLTLQLPGGGTPAAILSEGEQRAIAIASFLAELRLNKGRGGILLDDPVSSLDHRRRWEVAERLAFESLSRQVILFTHDIYFLCILEQKAEEIGATLSKNYIRRTQSGFGVHSTELPFDVLGTKDRIARLRQALDPIRKASKDGDDDLHRKLTTEAYGHLRLAWERCIEEVLFNEAIQRFGEGVMTQRLKQVVVTDDDYREIDAGMTKSSKFEHDAATRVSRLPIPDPDELSSDIEKLEAWRKIVIQRRAQVAAPRP